MKMMVDVNKTTGFEAELTHEEIAKEMAISRAYVSILEKSALDKIRRVLRTRYDVYSPDDLL
jgi:DNA-directed RNA polymerase specialized sigma subunit